MKVLAPSLAPMLRSDTQGRLLARVLVDPEREHNLSELVALAGSSMPTIQREVTRAEHAGIVTTRKVGPVRLVRANPAHPLYDAVRRLVLATYGPPAVIARAFGKIDGADAVVLFGSWADRYLGGQGRAPNDIDVLVIGSPDRDAIDDAAERAEQEIGVPVQATVRARSTWMTANENFIREVQSAPFVVVLVDDVDQELTGQLNAFTSSPGTHA